MHLYEELTEIFQPLSSKEDAQAMSQYMRNKFDFFGIRSPIIKEAIKPILKEIKNLHPEEVKDLVSLCWEDKHREFQYTACQIMGKYLNKMDESFIPFLEDLIAQKSWWDTVDWIAPTGLGKLLLRYPDYVPTLPDKWIASDNFWYQRTALIFQLKYKDQTNFDLLCKYILKRADSKEFFVQKAAGWSLRQYSRIDANKVKAFISKNELASLTVREGLKLMK